MQENVMKPQFIGQSGLEEVARRIQTDILTGPAVNRAEYFTRMGFKLVAGVQFKDIAYILNRKGGTTRRKVVGKPLKSQLGFLEERPMEVKLVWNQFHDNKDAYTENPVIDPGTGLYSYPLSELAMKEAVKTFDDDILDNIWHGDASLSDEDALGLFTGFITYINQDKEKARISVANGNFQACDTIEAPASTTDTGALRAFDEWHESWSPKLKLQPKVLVYGTNPTLMAIADAYSNSKNQNKEANFLPNGNFIIPRYANVEFCPDDMMGVGDMLIATIPQNFQLGVDSEGDDAKIAIMIGTPNDLNEVLIQVQAKYGTRVLNVNSYAFCMSDGSLAYRALSGDYRKDTFTVLSNNTTLGNVSVNGADPDNTKEYEAGTTLTLVATAESGGEFVKWSNGATAATITVVTKGQPEAITAIFKAI
ncbi:MAG: hypothetical protein IJ557_02500 [Bacteroidaceae bacterium]|nr:hypothetical protein [Bacteroidaceae bacterium]